MVHIIVGFFALAGGSATLSEMIMGTCMISVFSFFLAYLGWKKSFAASKKWEIGLKLLRDPNRESVKTLFLSVKSLTTAR